MKNVSYRVKGDTCVTRCPFGEDRMVGSFECMGCRRHFQKLPSLKQVICL